MKLSPISPSRTKHKPLISFKELAKEFGKTAAQLRGMLAARDAPKPKMQFRGAAYYDQGVSREWLRGKVGV